MIPYANLKPGRGFKPRQAGLYYAQRITTDRSVRRTVSRAIASVIRLRHGAGLWVPVAPCYETVVATLREQGLAVLPSLVSTAQLQAILDYFEGKDVVGAGGRLMSRDQLPPDTMMASYSLTTILESPDVLSLLNTAPILRIAADYLGCKPTLSSLGVRWSFPGGQSAEGTQLFHRDPDDWRFLKFFVYLTDVDAGAGPHAYIVRSHLQATQLRSHYYSQRTIDEQYGKANTRIVTGPAGTAFLADTSGIHAGLVPTDTPRLILQAQYSLLPVYALRYQPMASQEAAGFDPYVNRLLLAT